MYVSVRSCRSPSTPFASDNLGERDRPPDAKTTRQTTHRRNRHLDGYPDQVTIVRSRHPFEGSALDVLGWCNRRNELHLTLVLPDGTRALIPAAWTDLPIAQPAPFAVRQRARVAFLASHAELLHART